MKKKYVYILLAVFVVLIIIGILGAVSASNTPGTTTKVSSQTDVLHIENLDDVRSASFGNNVVKDYEGFRVSFNPTNHTPDWVAWELLGTETEGDVPRYDKFAQDPDVVGCPTTDDYRRSGYDRGHLCPAADQKWSELAMKDCFYLTNIAPQAKALNTGAWKTLESKERLWAQRDSALVIVAGPIYETTDRERIGETGVRVPSAFFKAILAPYLESPRAIAFVYPNQAAPGNMANYAMSIDELEQLTGYDFFYNLPDEIENEVERTTSFNEWNRR